MTKQADLLAYLFEGQSAQEAAELLAAELGQWLLASSRFTAFVDTYRDKIRKKIRVNREPESVLDVRSELEVAYRLLNDRRLAVAYEPYASAKIRGPDFSVTYRDNLVFNIEVARMRVEAALAGDTPEHEPRPGAEAAPDRARLEERILRIVLDKLGQMQPGLPNLLIIHTHPDIAHLADLDRLLREVKIKVDGKDPAFYAFSRYPTPAAFYKDFLHLCGILLWAPPAPKLWVNKQARPGLDDKVLRLISTLPG
jgi:hypothetical protein